MFLTGQGSPSSASSLLLAVSGRNRRAGGEGLPGTGLWDRSPACHGSPAAERAAPQHGEALTFLAGEERGTGSQPSSPEVERNAESSPGRRRFAGHPGKKAHFPLTRFTNCPLLLAAFGSSAVASSPQKPAVPMAVLRRFPFSSALRRMSVLGKAPGNSPVEAFMKGAPETVAGLCKKESGLC